MMCSIIFPSFSHHFPMEDDVFPMFFSTFPSPTGWPLGPLGLPDIPGRVGRANCTKCIVGSSGRPRKRCLPWDVSPNNEVKKYVSIGIQFYQTMDKWMMFPLCFFLQTIMYPLVSSIYTIHNPLEKIGIMGYDILQIQLWGYYGVLWYYIKIGIHNMGMMGVLWYYIYGVFSISQYTSFYQCIVVVTPIYIIYEVKNGSFSMGIMGYYGYHGFLEKNVEENPWIRPATGCAMALPWLAH